MDNLLSYEQVAEKLGVSRGQLRYYIAHYKIPYVKLGERKRLIKESDLEAFINRNTFRKK